MIESLFYSDHTKRKNTKLEPCKNMKNERSCICWIGNEAFVCKVVKERFFNLENIDLQVELAYLIKKKYLVTFMCKE